MDPLEFVHKQHIPVKFSILARNFQCVLSCIDCGLSVVNMLCHSGGALYALWIRENLFDNRPIVSFCIS